MKPMKPKTSSKHPVYTFHNSGNSCHFNPHARIGDRTELEFYLDLVALAQNPAMFVLDHKGKEILVPEHA